MYSVLYVDDSAELRELGKLYLETIGDFTVTTADSADHALVTLKNQAFDLILSDFDMPGMNGIGFLTEVRARYHDVPFILFTARGRDEIVEEAITHGADFYLQKGGDAKAQFAELAHKIRQAVRRQKAENALAENRDYLDKIFSSVKAGIMVIDAATHTVIDVNPAAMDMIGAPKDRIVGKVCHRFVCPAEDGRCPITDLGQDVDNSEKILITAGGKKVPIIKYVTSVEIAGKLCLLETFIDNTARKRAEEERMAAYDRLMQNQEELHAAYAQIAANEQVLADDYQRLNRSEHLLRENEDRFRSLFESANDAIILVSGGTITACNQKALRMFGCTDKNQIVGRSPDNFSPEFQPDGTRSSDRIREHDAMVIGGSGTSFEWLHLRRDGTPFTADVSLNAVSIGGKPWILSVIRDVSDRRLAEQAVRLARKKLHMMNDVSRHEIRATIAGLLDQVQKAERENQGVRQSSSVREIRSSISRLERQIRFTEEYEEIGIHPPRWLPLDQLVPSTDHIRIVRDPDLGKFEIFADPLVTKVFRYLAENTIRHGIRATEIRFAVSAVDTGLHISVGDNGTGIPAADKKKIFHRTGGDRIGMGLFLVREILAITGITIEEDGVPGEGAHFRILVPETAFRKRT